MFSNGQDLAYVLLSSNLIHNAVATICKGTPTSNQGDSPSPISIEVSDEPNGKIIAFVVSPTCTVQHLEAMGKDLVPITRNTRTPFEFIATKVNHSFSINKAAADVFDSLFVDQLTLLQDKINISKPLLIMGNSLGGSIASLFTLWLLDTIYLNKSKRPICITFGSPLLGDIHFQRAISERSSWRSCFVHVVSNRDPIPRLFLHTAEPASLAPPTYKPFGSFLICSQSGCAIFDDPESIFELMVAMSSESVGNMDFNGIQINHYEEVLGCLKKNARCKGISELGDSAVNPLQVGLNLQLKAIGVIKTQQRQQQQQNNDMNSLVEKIKKRQEDALKHKRKNVDDRKKLNDIKISMAYLEWYKKVTVNQGGYYDGYKYAGTRDEKRSKAEIVKHQIILTQYWKHTVLEADQMPQKEAVSLRTSCLYGGTNYRRMVEPLDIADYYKRGKRDYINSERSKHYQLLEEWLNDDKKPRSQTSEPSERKKASLTEDSCFWAHVEEAVISLGVLKDGVSSQESKKLERQNLIKFEDYVMRLIRSCSVSPEIFLEKSTFMKWWEEYKKYKERDGTSYYSFLAKFMTDEKAGYI